MFAWDIDEVLSSFTFSFHILYSRQFLLQSFDGLGYSLRRRIKLSQRQFDIIFKVSKYEFVTDIGQSFKSCFKNSISKSDLSQPKRTSWNKIFVNISIKSILSSSFIRFSLIIAWQRFMTEDSRFF